MFHSLLLQFADQIAEWQVSYIGPALKFLQLFFGLLTLLGNNYLHYPKQANVQDGQKFDFVIVGGGTAGCVLANRLTENPEITVLLVEYGDLPPLYSDIPGFFALLTQSPEDWHIYSTNDGYSSQAHKTKNVHLSAGKMLGGSSGVSFMAHIRGVKADYDKWEAMGNKGWGWASVLPYFKKCENIDDVTLLKSESADSYGTNGSTLLTRPKWTDRTKEYFEAFEQNGRKSHIDLDRHSTLGYFHPLFTFDDDIRTGVSYSYIRPIKKRRNLFILRNTKVEKILFNEKVATGVEVLLPNGFIITVNAKKEVLICAGVLNSPKLLMLSGIGPKNHLRDKNVKLVHDSPNVGENLMDTSITLVLMTGNKNIQSFVENIDLLTNLDKFPVPVFVGHAALNKSQEFPDYQSDNIALPAGSIIPASFCTWLFGLEDNICKNLVKTLVYTETLFGVHGLLHPESRGSVRLQSNKSECAPVVCSGYYSNQNDLNRHARYLIDYLSVLDTKYFRNVNGQVINLHVKQCKHITFNTFEYWKCHILNTASSMWNLAGTCSMGLNEIGVVDYRLNIKGLENIRVVDASVIPSTISGNINAAVLMIAEKAADMIKEDHHLK